MKFPILQIVFPNHILCYNMREFLSRSGNVDKLIDRIKKLVIRELKAEHPDVSLHRVDHTVTIPDQTCFIHIDLGMNHLIKHVISRIQIISHEVLLLFYYRLTFTICSPSLPARHCLSYFRCLLCLL